MTTKTFEMTHLFFSCEETFTEENPPQWLISSGFKWWYEGYVLKLEIGESIDSDSRRISRIS